MVGSGGFRGRVGQDPSAFEAGSGRIRQENRQFAEARRISAGQGGLSVQACWRTGRTLICRSRNRPGHPPGDYEMIVVGSSCVYCQRIVPFFRGDFYGKPGVFLRPGCTSRCSGRRLFVAYFVFSRLLSGSGHGPAHRRVGGVVTDVSFAGLTEGSSVNDARGQIPGDRIGRADAGPGRVIQVAAEAVGCCAEESGPCPRRVRRC